MSAVTASDLTRTCVLSGVSAERWTRLLKLQMAKEPKGDEMDPEESACRSLLELLVSFPSSDLIQKYLETALDSALIPLPVYISTFPHCILSTHELQSRPALWPRLIALALKAHQFYSTESLSPNSSPPVVLYDSKPPAKNAETIESVIKLLQLSYAFPASQAVATASLFEQICQSLTTLLVLLLSAISSPTHARLPPASTASLIQSVTDFAESYPLGDAKLALESWVLSFSLASGAMAYEDNLDEFLGTDIGFGINEPQLNGTDSAPAANDAIDIPVTEEDLVAPATLIQSLLANRATRTHGPHCTPHAVSLLLETYRSTIIPAPARPVNPTPSISPTTAMQTRAPTTIGPTTGGTPVRTPSGTGVPQARTPANSSSLLQSIQSSLGRTPTVPGVNASTPNPHPQVHTPVATLNQTPAGRTPARTPGPSAKHVRTPTAQHREIRKPGQIRAQVFYEKLFVAAITMVAQEVGRTQMRRGDVSDQLGDGNLLQKQLGLAEAFVLGKLPILLRQFRDVASASSSSSKSNQPSLQAALEGALSSIFVSYIHILDSCDPTMKGAHKRRVSIGIDGQPSVDELMANSDDTPAERATEGPATDRLISGFRRKLLMALIEEDLITQRFAKGIIPSGDGGPNSPSKAPDTSRDETDDELHMLDRDDGLILGEGEGKIQKEAHEAGMDLLGYCDRKLSHDAAMDDITAFLMDAANDAGSHAAISTAILKRWRTLVSTSDIGGLNILAKILSEHVAILDILSLHIPIVELVEECLVFLDDYEFDAVGDPQWALTLLGPIFLFVQLCVYHFGLSNLLLQHDGRKLSVDFLAPKIHVPEMQSFSADEKVVFKGWLEAVFASDSSSEGISDKLLRTTPPKLLLRMGAALFCAAIKTNGTDIEALRSGGVAFFLEPLLNWSLVGVLRGLVEDAFRRGYLATLNFQVIQTLVLDTNCPKPVIQMAGRCLLRLIDDPVLQAALKSILFDSTSVKQRVNRALGISDGGPVMQVIGPTSLKAMLTQSSQADYTSSLPLSLSGLSSYPTKHVMDSIYATLMSVARAGPYSRSCRYLAISVISLPHPVCARSPALLPYFIHTYLPRLLASLDHVSTSDRSLTINVMAVLVSWSLLVSFRAEKALFDVKGVLDDLEPQRRPVPNLDDMEMDDKSKRRDVSGSEVTSMAKALARKLRISGGASALLYQKVQATPYFASNFPSFSNA
ncbi:mediator complex subunit [Tulasnella sp. JGI-2019a]|nr:mediator complex subunit [Tulasnella sp. JGI-2019a]